MCIHFCDNYNFIKIERNKWGANSIIRKINYRVYICTCKVTSVDEKYTASYAFLYDSCFKSLEKQYCGALIDNRKGEHICALGDNYR